jgi:hypothetical protein
MYFQKFFYGSSHMTSEGLGEMFEADFADTGINNLLLVPAKCQACPYTGERTPVRGNFNLIIIVTVKLQSP